MTAKKIIKKLAKLGIDANGIEITGKDEIELWAGDAVGSEKLMKKVVKAIAGLGGYKTGYGSWVLRPGYVSTGDWNNPSSRCHY